MPYLNSLPPNAGPPNIFARYPDVYGPWSIMSEAMMNGPSPLGQGERELILAYAAGVAGCSFVSIAHAEVAYAWGVERGLLDALLADPDTAPVEPKLKPILAFVRKLALSPSALSQADTDAVIEAGWSEEALHSAIAITARAAFMQKLVEGYGFTPLPRETAAAHAKKRVERGYVNIYRAFRTEG